MTHEESEIDNLNAETTLKRLEAAKLERELSARGQSSLFTYWKTRLAA